MKKRRRQALRRGRSLFVPTKSWFGSAFRFMGRFRAHFPRLSNTGHSHNFSIKEEHLELWTGLHVHEIQTIGRARVNRQLVELKDAAVAVYPNTAGERDSLQEKPPFLLMLPEGIAVHHASDPFAAAVAALGRAVLWSGIACESRSMASKRKCHWVGTKTGRRV